MGGSEVAGVAPEGQTGKQEQRGKTTLEPKKILPYYQFNAPIPLEILSEEDIQRREEEAARALKTQETQWTRSLEINKGMREGSE